jgi:hypothetical protein
VGLNDAGAAVGSVVATVNTHDASNLVMSSVSPWQAFVWNADRFTILDGPLPTHDPAYGVSINNRGQIAGELPAGRAQFSAWV